MLERRVVVSPDVLAQEVSGETVLLDLRSENYFGLNEVGTRFWQLLKEKRNLGEILDQLADEYDVAPQQLNADIEQLVAELDEAGLIELNAGAGLD